MTLRIANCSNRLPKTHPIRRGKCVYWKLVTGEKVTVLLQYGGTESKLVLEFFVVLIVSILIRQVDLDSIDKLCWG